LTFIEARSPALVVLATQQIGSITEPDELNRILKTLFTLQTAEEVEQYLLTVGYNSKKN
jgi:hypothetical protein